VEGDIVLAHELDVADIVRPLVRPPPVAPGGPGRLGPFLGRADVFDGGVEPDIEDLALHPRTRAAVRTHHRHTPFQVAGDAPVDQPLVEMFQGDRPGQGLPVMLRADPRPDPVRQLGLQQIQVPRVPDLEIARARHRRIGIDQVGRVQQPPAVVALVAPRTDMAAVRTGALDIAVGQEAGVIDRIDHPVDPLLDQAVLLQNRGEMLCQPLIGRVRRPAEPVVAEAEGLARRLLDLMLFIAIGAHVLTGGRSGQLGRGAMLVRGADVEHLMALGPLEPRIDVRRQHRPGEVPQMLDAVDVRQGRGDEDAGHGGQGLGIRDWPWLVASAGGHRNPDAP